MKNLGLQTALQNILTVAAPADRVILLTILLRELWAAQLDERAGYWARDGYPTLRTATTVAELAAGLHPLLESTILISPAWPVITAAPVPAGGSHSTRVTLADLHRPANEL